MSDILSLIISLISGAAGGNITGALISEKNMGTIANTVIGLLGGGVGDFILKALGILASTGAAGAAGATTGHELDLAALLANIAGSGLSGGALTAIVAFIKDALSKR